MKSKLSLTPIERLQLAGIFPEKGNRIYLKKREKALNDLIFSDEEAKKYIDFEKTKEEQAKGNNLTAFKKDMLPELTMEKNSIEVDFGELLALKLMDILKDMEKKEELTTVLGEILDKFEESDESTEEKKDAKKEDSKKP